MGLSPAAALPTLIPPPWSVSPQPAVSAALYLQLVQGKPGEEALAPVREALAHVDRGLAQRGTTYLTGVSGARKLRQVGGGEVWVPQSVHSGCAHWEGASGCGGTRAPWHCHLAPMIFLEYLPQCQLTPHDILDVPCDVTPMTPIPWLSLPCDAPHFPCQDAESVADVVVWGALFPLFQDGSCLPGRGGWWWVGAEGLWGAAVCSELTPLPLPCRQPGAAGQLVPEHEPAGAVPRCSRSRADP